MSKDGNSTVLVPSPLVKGSSSFWNFLRGEGQGEGFAVSISLNAPHPADGHLLPNWGEGTMQKAPMPTITVRGR